MTPKEHTPNADKSAQSFEIRTEYLRSILKATPAGQYPDKVLQSAWELVKMTYDESSDFRRIKNLIKRNEIDQALEIIKSISKSGKFADIYRIFLAYVCSLGEKKTFQSNQLFCFADNKDIINRLRVYSGRRIAERKGLDFAFMLAARIENHDERILFKQAVIDHHIRSVYTLNDALYLVKHITDSTELMEYLLTIAAIREIFQGSMKDALPESFQESIHLQWAGNVTKGFRKPM